MSFSTVVEQLLQCWRRRVPVGEQSSGAVQRRGGIGTSRVQPILDPSRSSYRAERIPRHDWTGTVVDDSSILYSNLLLFAKIKLPGKSLSNIQIK